MYCPSQLGENFPHLLFFCFGYMLILFQDKVIDLEGSFMDMFFVGTFYMVLVKLKVIKSIKMAFI